jgi:hypothetical protein
VTARRCGLSGTSSAGESARRTLLAGGAGPPASCPPLPAPKDPVILMRFGQVFSVVALGQHAPDREVDRPRHRHRQTLRSERRRSPAPFAWRRDLRRVGQLD